MIGDTGDRKDCHYCGESWPLDAYSKSTNGVLRDICDDCWPKVNRKKSNCYKRKADETKEETRAWERCRLALEFYRLQAEYRKNRQKQ